MLEKEWESAGSNDLFTYKHKCKSAIKPVENEDNNRLFTELSTNC